MYITFCSVDEKQKNPHWLAIHRNISTAEEMANELRALCKKNGRIYAFSEGIPDKALSPTMQDMWKQDSKNASNAFAMAFATGYTAGLHAESGWSKTLRGRLEPYISKLNAICADSLDQFTLVAGLAFMLGSKEREEK